MEYGRKLLQSNQKRCFLAAIFILILIFITLKVGGPHYCHMVNIKRKVEYVCIEDPDIQNKTGIEDVKPLPIFFQENYQWDNSKSSVNGRQYYKPSQRNDMDFTQSEKNRISSCMKNYPDDFEKGKDEFWSGTQQQIRRTHHKYLVPGESIMVEVGGNVGEDAQVFLDMYKPKYYVMLEPLKLLYRRLQQRFKNYSNVYTYNVGLGAKYDRFMIKMEGNDGDATSPFFGSGQGTCSLKIVNATDFFTKLAVGNYQIDLMTINCEGCEYDLLETLLSTDLIYQFRHIQFGTHPTLKNLRDPVRRYCKIQEWLRRSHKLTYQYKFQWETWKLKDL